MLDFDHVNLSVADAVEDGWSYRSRTNPAKRMIMQAQAPSSAGIGWGRLCNDSPLSSDETLAILRMACGEGALGLVLSFSHDDYLNVAGGVQNCVGDEQAALQANGWTYLHLCPNEPKPSLATLTAPSVTTYLATVNGKRAGVVKISDLQMVIRNLRRDGLSIQYIVHHLLGFSPEHLALLVREGGREIKPYVWVHDLFTLCPSVTMLRNQAHFCGGPPPASSVCRVCHAGTDRIGHVARVKQFFEETVPIVLAPSNTILQFWASHADYPYDRAHVVPPCTIEFDCPAPQYTGNRPLRIGFLGAPAYHKGWHEFESLARWHKRDSRYEFYHCGWSDTHVPSVKFVKATVSRQDRSAMITAATNASIDVALNWSICFESFSFTTHEALAAGAFVVARRGAGNVSRLLSTDFSNRGCLVGSEIELSALFESGQIVDLVKASSRDYGNLHYGRGAGEVMVGESIRA